jgi:hypothetical protein
MTIKSKVLKSLCTGRSFTAKQLANMSKTTEGTIRARISDLRLFDGYQIVTGSKNDKTVYSMR